MKQKIRIGVPAAGCVLMFVFSCVFAALLAAVYGGGLLSLDKMPLSAVIITFLSCLLGGFWVSGKAEKMPLPNALISAAAYLLLVFVLRGLVFRSVGERALFVIISGMIGSLLGTVASAGRAGRKRR